MAGIVFKLAAPGSPDFPRNDGLLCSLGRVLLNLGDSLALSTLSQQPLSNLDGRLVSPQTVFVFVPIANILALPCQLLKVGQILIPPGRQCLLVVFNWTSDIEGCFKCLS